MKKSTFQSNQTVLLLKGIIVPSRTIVTRKVVILPPTHVSLKAIELSKKLNDRFDTTLQLNAHVTLPHLTLHQFALPEDRLPELEIAVGSVAKLSVKPSVELVEISLGSNGTICWRALAQAIALWEIHKRLLHVIAPLQEGYLPAHLMGVSTGEIESSLAERSALLKHGNPWANITAPEAPYKPHITLSKLKNQDDTSAALTLLGYRNIRFDGLSLHIAELGPSGTCAKSLKEFHFR